MKNANFRRHTTLACILFGLIVAALLLRSRNDSSGVSAEIGESARSNSVLLEPPVRPAPVLDLRDAIAQLRSAKEGLHIKSLLTQLEQRLAAAPPHEASQYLVELLQAGEDQATGLSFVVGPDGFLKEAPTLRVFLLEQLEKIDPAAAAVYAETILGTYASPDEWAISLRTYAKRPLTVEQRQYLQQKVRELLHHPSWQKEPSVGYLEAFDVALYLKSPELTPDLAGLVRLKDNQAVAQAAYLALDRLVMELPVQVLDQLQKQPDLMSGRELTRAQYFARVDLRDPDQKNVLEGYLLNPGLTSAEAKAFAEVFPNANFMVSQNLLTQMETPSGNQIKSRDLTTFHTVLDWLDDPRFVHRQTDLLLIKRRLEGFVGSPPSGRE